MAEQSISRRQRIIDELRKATDEKLPLCAHCANCVLQIVASKQNWNESYFCEVLHDYVNVETTIAQCSSFEHDDIPEPQPQAPKKKIIP